MEMIKTLATRLNYLQIFVNFNNNPLYNDLIAVILKKVAKGKYLYIRITNIIKHWLILKSSSSPSNRLSRRCFWIWFAWSSSVFIFFTKKYLRGSYWPCNTRIMCSCNFHHYSRVHDERKCR